MITNPAALEAFEHEFSQKEHLTLDQKFALLNALYLQARQFGHFTEADQLEGLEHDIELARRLNSYVPAASR